MNKEILQLFHAPYEVVKADNPLEYIIKYESGAEIYVAFPVEMIEITDEVASMLCNEFIGRFMYFAEEISIAQGETDEIVRSFYTLFLYFANRLGIDAKSITINKPENQTPE